MRNQKNRREFLGHIGSGMLIAGVGAKVAAEIGCSSAFAFEGPPSYRDQKRLNFGKLHPLVRMMQEQKPATLQQNLISKLQKGETNLKQLVAAAALANAETFGGEDYVGYHTEMALVPSLGMAHELPRDRQPLPVLKVIYRNAQQIQQVGGSDHTTLHHHHHESGSAENMGERIRTAARSRDMKQAENLFASVNDIPMEERFNAILPTIEDDINVHRFVLAQRSLELVDVVGQDHSHTMLRQCIRYCVDEEQKRHNKGRRPSAIRKLLPKLMDQYQLAGRELGSRIPDDAWVESLGNTIYERNEFQAADAVAAALAEGISPLAVAEAISLAANLLVLRQGADRWRTHGDSPGVHASDAANAWRNMIPVANHVNTVGGLICSAFHTGRYKPFKHDPYPTEAHRLKVKVATAKELLGLTEECIRSNDQAVAAAAIQVYGDRGYDIAPAFKLMLKYAISEDGRLHAEKYYRTVKEEFKNTRKAFRWRQMVALARVTASAYGFDRFDNRGHRAPGYEQACKILKVST